MERKRGGERERGRERKEEEREDKNKTKKECMTLLLHFFHAFVSNTAYSYFTLGLNKPTSVYPVLILNK